MEDFRSKKVLIVGAGVSGAAAAELLMFRGAEVTVADARGASELPELGAPWAKRARLLLGGGFPQSPAGFDLIVISPGVPIGHPLLEAARERGVPVTGELELAQGMIGAPCAAVTGSNGKTTTAALTQHILVRLGAKTWLGGNIGEPLARLALSRLQGAGDGSGGAVLEVSSFQLETAERFHARGAALLNVTPDHLDRHGIMAEYLSAKSRIFLNQTESDLAVVNLDDPLVRSVPLRARAFGFSRRGAPAFGASSEEDRGVRLIRVYEGGKTVAEAPASSFRARGPHNEENIMAAVGLAHSLGAEFAPALAAAADFQPKPHRVQKIGEWGGVSWWDDSKGTNTGAVAAALEGFPRGSVILIMGGRDKDMDFSALKEPVREKVKKLILLGEAREKLAKALGGSAPFAFAGGMDEAADISGSLAAPGDAVLLSPGCASFDMFRDYRERGDVFRRAALRVNGQAEDAPAGSRAGQKS
jgi:UDP-N-acetylmuramoylalanine--D-glutamate ligase